MRHYLITCSRLLALTCISTFLCTLLLATPCLAAKDLFSAEINRAVDNAIAAWHNNDSKGMNQALRRLTTNEARLLAAGLSDENRSYLRLVPLSCNRKPESVVACLYFLREQRRRDIVLLDIGQLFSGKTFRFIRKNEEVQR